MFDNLRRAGHRPAQSLQHHVGYNLVSGGTENHLILMDLTKQDITGKDAEIGLDKAGITVNKNTVPFETRSPFVTSGVRLGTPALTTRGMKTDDMRRVGKWIVQVLQNLNNKTPSKIGRASCRERV